jgi:ankyrin repeat protein
VQTARVLHAAGADVLQQDADGYLPVYHAAQSGCFDTMRWLLSLGANPRAASRDGSLPLHSACAAAQADTAEHLLSYARSAGAAAADLSAVDTAGLTPLHLAAASGSEGVVKLLLQRDADVTTAAARH